jgi:pilus assembly protein Flp/PilA
MKLRAFLSDDTGQGLVEYALILSLVSIVAIVALKFLGGKATNSINNTASQMS